LASKSCALAALVTCEGASSRAGASAVMLTVPLKLVNSRFLSSKSYAFSEEARELEALIDEWFY
jgi:hypothetical protein